MTGRDVRGVFQERYAGEPLVRVGGDVPAVRDVSGWHGVMVGGFAVGEGGSGGFAVQEGGSGGFAVEEGAVEEGGSAGGAGEGGRVVVCATIDNLLKGAATQCLQNVNLACGFAEFEGIPLG